MKDLKILIVGGGIGGLTSAIALGRMGHEVEVIEKDPAWGVYGVGIIQQSNVVRAMSDLGLLDDYLEAGFGFDRVEVRGPDGAILARLPSPRLVDGKPANVGVRRPALHQVLGDRAKEAGAIIRLGVTVASLEDDGEAVAVAFSDGTSARYDVVIGADGLYSDTRSRIFPEAAKPRFTGQCVWRYNLERPDGLDCLQTYVGPVTAGLVPLSDDLMYMFIVTAEPDNARYPQDGLAASMRAKLEGGPPQLVELGCQITENDGVVYRPLEVTFLDGPWHKGRVVLLGDAVHACTPHLGQGAGMAIEDAIVLAEELSRSASPDEAFANYQTRRFERCRFIVDASQSIGDSQLGIGPPVDQAVVSKEMFEVTAEPI